jgi:hypothetical protein
MRERQRDYEKLDTKTKEKADTFISRFEHEQHEREDEGHE